MDVASGDGKEIPASELITSELNSLEKHILNETAKSTSSSNSALKDDLSSSKSNISSGSNTSRPSTDSTIAQENSSLNVRDIVKSSTDISIKNSTTNSIASIVKITKSDASETTTVDIKKVEIPEKVEENHQTQSNQIATIGVPLARSSPISREYLALQKSLNESKILTEFVTETSAIKAARKAARKSCLMIRDNSLNKSSNRSRTDPLEITNEERALGKRNMRSQNTEFAQKHMEFLNRIIQQQQSGDEQYGSEADEMERSNASVNAEEDDEQTSTSISNSGVIAFDLADISSLDARLKGIWQPTTKHGWDSFCWRCRECGGVGGTLIPCSKCVRSFHKTCVKISTYTKLDNNWLCPECIGVENALNSPKKTRRPDLSLDMMSELLAFALKRMRTSKGNGKFLFSEGDYSYLSKYLVNPVTFTTLEEKIAKKAFRCPEEFYNETKWMIHNAHIITTGFTNHKLLVTAKAIVKVCRQETNEIETCAGCYLSANTRSDWFVDVCAQPHILLWAKLKGFPYWPAKAMGIGPNSVVNVRFFGKHDRAFVPIKDCYLYSQQDPNLQTGKRSQRELADCIKEVEEHIKNIVLKIGKFNYAPLKTLYDPNEELQQLELMMPGVGQYIKRQAQAQVMKPSLQYKIVKTAGNHLSIIKKSNNADGNEVNEIKMDNITETLTRKDSKGSVASADSGSASVSCDSTKHLNTPKYEVITKTINSDSDSPKVTAVILKKRRKTSSPSNNEKEETIIESKTLKTADMTSATTTTSSPAIIVNSHKRKQHTSECSPGERSGDSGSEKHKAKHARTEPRLPIITIKTGTAKIVEQNAREVVEHLTKSNAGVTIKKLNKIVMEPIANKTNEANVTRATRSSAAKDPIVKDNKLFTTMAVTQKSITDKSEKSEERRNIFRELVPFVEVKEEIISDAEEETTVPTTTNKDQATNVEKILPTNESTQQLTSTIVINEPLIANVKEEIMSDEEIDGNPLNTAVTNSISNKQSKANNKMEAATTTIRLVGDTIIQRLQTKQATSQAITNAITSTTSTVTTTTTTSKVNNTMSAPLTTTPINITNNNANKRISTRSGGGVGIPFGPLPATATNSSTLSLTGKTNNNKNTINELQQTNEPQTQQRARKTFPNPSPPPPPTPTPTRIMNTMPITKATQRNSNATSPPAALGNTTNLTTDLKRNNSMLKSTSMVSIPADIAAQRNISQMAVPMPPLTAVSKMLPTPTTATNSIAGTAPNLTATRIGTITPAAFANSSISNSNNNNNQSTAFTPSIKMSAPPPLAGLSSITNSISSANAICNNQQTTATTTTTTAASNALTTANIATSSTTNNNLSNVNPELNSTENHLLGDFVTPALANAITEVICRGPPKMAPRPNGPLQSDGSTMFPSEAGPVCRTLVQNAHKLTDFFISVMEDTMCEMSNNDEPSLQAKITLLTIELERMKQAHEQEIAELKRTSDLMLCEMRKSMENEKTRIANEIRKQCELERLRCVEEAKRKQWCANCSREAQFYCCWNTSYCDYPCQQQHWARHAASCAQTRPNNDATSGSNTLQPMITSASSMNPLAMNTDGRNKTSSSTTVNVHYNKNLANSKKDKHVATGSALSKNTMNVANVSPIITNVSGELLKLPSLPSNTSLRPVTVSNVTANTQTRTPANMNVAATSGQQQRFNISLPISSTSAVNPRAPYTIVQRGNSWELMTSTSNTMAPINTISTVSATQSLTNVKTQQQQQRTASNLNMNMGRTRGVSIMTYNGNIRSTQM